MAPFFHTLTKSLTHFIAQGMEEEDEEEGEEEEEEIEGQSQKLKLDFQKSIHPLIHSFILASHQPPPPPHSLDFVFL